MFNATFNNISVISWRLYRNEGIPCACGKIKWLETLNCDELHWTEIFRFPFVITKNTKLQ
jgi:hypothetical protein